MSEPTSTTSTSTTSTSTARKFGDTSMDEDVGVPKALKFDSEPPEPESPEGMPRYTTMILNILTEVKATVEAVKEEVTGVKAEMKEMKGELTATAAKMQEMSVKVEVLEEKVEIGASKTIDIEQVVEELRLENRELRSELKEMRGDLDEQIDRSLRDHISFYGMSGNDKKWEETTERVVDWLTEHLGGNKTDWDNAIYRCHRGPFNPDKPGPRPIFAHMNDRKVQQIKFRMKFNSIAGVSIRDQMSANTQKRVNDALVYRKHLKSLPENEGAKIFVSYPANVKIKRNTDSNYNIERRF